MSCLFIQTIFFPVDLKKADKSQLTDLLTRIEFLQANQALHKLIEDLFQKLTNAEEELRSLISALESLLDAKSDREELEQLREWLEKRFKALSNRIRAVRAVSPMDTTVGDDAAGLRRGLMQHFHCISCDRPLQVSVLPDYAESGRLLSCRTARPCATTHEVDYYTGHLPRTGYIDPPIRRSGLNIYDLYGIPRRCGGTHTRTNPQRRVNRGNTARSAVVGSANDEHGKSLPYISPREEVSIEGHDGHIYRGRYPMADNVPMNGEARDPSHSPLRNSNDDSAEPVKFPHLPSSRSALSGWPQSNGPSPRNLRLLTPHQSGSSERAVIRRVQLVQPNVHAVNGLTTTPSGYAVIAVPKADETDGKLRAKSRQE
ncbi:Glutamine-rich protein 2 [Fasciolopsis buskii]|uniref:Glutamine-rich protein 2 n=1 Tax=Fasciolopsis buskii TaxID=27845 RepID=A0A8E0VJ65_9TREM|nr:Glutamine-rich protein 2 [Fasciolopsis buski]